MYPNSGHYPNVPQAQGHSVNAPVGKKAKAGLVITRYPLPPGYTGPTQSENPSWPQQHPMMDGFPQPQYPHPSHHQYAQPQTMGQPPPHMYPPQFGGHPGYHQGYQAITPQTMPGASWYPQYEQGYPEASPQIAPGPGRKSRRRKSKHNHEPRHVPAHNGNNTQPLDGNGDAMSPEPFPMAFVEDLEEDFDAECYFARHPDEIDPDLSLGVIEWRPPGIARRALPATFDEAELEALAPRIFAPDDREPVSDLFSKANRGEAFLSIRDTDAWEQVKDSLIFKKFDAVCTNIISREDLLQNYRCQFDAKWEADEPRSPSPEPSREATPAGDGRDRSNGDHMDIDDEQVHTSKIEEVERDMEPDYRRGSMNSLHGSASSYHTAKLTRPTQLPPLRDQRQEDILAALGVTGGPGPVYQTPGPALAPEYQRESRNDSVSNARETTRDHSMTNRRRDYQAKGRCNERPNSSQSHDSASGSAFGDDRRRNHRPSSSHSRHKTANDSVLGVEPGVEPGDDATRGPKRSHNNNRKRSHGDTTAGTTDHRANTDGEGAPKQRRKQPRKDGSRR